MSDAPDAIRNRGYHAHIYYDPERTRPTAERLCDVIGQQFQVQFGGLRDEPVGPHPVANAQVIFAPEQFQGAPSSAAADLYAVGAILWEAATGRPLRSHADLMRGAIRAPLSADGRARIEAAHGPGLLRLLVLLLGDVPARRHDGLAAVEVDL